MSNFDVLIINIYLLAIFTNLIKTKTIIQIYRLFKLLVVALFVFVIVTIIQDEIAWYEALIKGLPLVLLFVVTIQTEALLVLKKVGFNEDEVNGILGNNWYNFYKSI